MRDLFDRQFSLVIEGSGIPKPLDLSSAINPESPLSVAFEVVRDVSNKPNTATIKIRNLSPDHRKQLDNAGSLAARLSAGYQQINGLIFIGDIRDVTHAREGADWITTLGAGDKEKTIKTARDAKSYAPGTPAALPVEDLVKSMGFPDAMVAKTVARFRASTIGKVYTAGTVTSGSAARELTQTLKAWDYQWTIQNGEIMILPKGKAAEAVPVILSELTGLVGSPTRGTKGEVSATSLLNPEICPGRSIVIQSSTVIGNYRAEKVTFSGDISGQEWFAKVEGKPL